MPLGTRTVFVYLAALGNVEVERTGVKAHSSLGLGERYHQPLRHTYGEIMSHYPSTEPTLALGCSVKAIMTLLVQRSFCHPPLCSVSIRE